MVVDEIGKLKANIDSLEERVAALEAALTARSADASTDRGDKQQSLREFINEKQPKSANDHGLVIAYFTEIVKQKGWFNVDDLKSGFREAKVPAPKNLSDVIGKNAKKGYFMLDEKQSGIKQAWVLTSTGEKAVDAGFSAGKDKK